MNFPKAKLLHILSLPMDQDIAVLTFNAISCLAPPPCLLLQVIVYSLQGDTECSDVTVAHLKKTTQSPTMCFQSELAGVAHFLYCLKGMHIVTSEMC